ncbi:MAG: hypothetical protein ACREJ3_11180, partial [Polyangiaceae bacterium]
VLHTVASARALNGDRAFSRVIDSLHRLPAFAVFEALLVVGPLLIHGGMGVWLVATRRALEPPTPYPSGVRVAVRVTGILAVIFLAVHLPELGVLSPGDHLDGGELATRLDGDLSSTLFGIPWRGVFYLIGAAAVTFHFAAGLWGAFAGTREARASVRKRRVAAWVAWVLGAWMWITWANVIVFRATGGELFGGDRQDSDSPACR